MNLLQYLLIKLAEEANEVAKEALKEAQFGCDSYFHGEPAAVALQHELADLAGVARMLSDQPEFTTLLAGDHLFPFQTPEPEIRGRINAKINKVCFYATVSHETGYLQLTDEQKAWVYDRARHHQELTRV
jgi:hypothetical protein